MYTTPQPEDNAYHMQNRKMSGSIEYLETHTNT